MKENIMGTKPVTPLLLGMAFPIMISTYKHKIQRLEAIEFK